ncbi:hypothetical protein ACLMJK_009623 [Lecanora helva]
MASSREPREDAVVDIVSITGLQREDAISNDANKAVNAFLENPNAILDQQSQVKFDEQQGQEGWNENHFHTDKAYSAQQSQSQLGNHPADVLRPNIFSDGAPSRPPSRVSARATTVSHGTSQSATVESEDEEMKRAMAMSMEDSQTMPNRETGSMEHQPFGPAIRDHYDENEWALTVTGPQTQEIILDPDPADRKRPTSAPAFLKPSLAGHRLPALLTILHAIPMARAALLSKTHTLADYGFDRDWWTGTPIKFLKIVDLNIQGQPVHTDDIIHEIQRLMAFLDETDRAYGSADALANGKFMGDADNDKVKNFFTAWHDATVDSVLLMPLVNTFTSVGTKVSTTNPQSEKFYCLTTVVDNEISGKGLTLYDVLDRLLWSDLREDEETFLEQVGDVFTLDVRNQVAGNSGLGIEIPAIWYADRYLPSCTKQAKDMLSRKANVAAELAAQKTAHEEITQTSNSKTGEKIDATNLFLAAKTYFEQTAKHQMALQDSETLRDLRDIFPVIESPGTTAQELENLCESISERTRSFEIAQGSAHKEIKKISEMYTKASDEPGQPPHHRYTLRGVATTSHTTYVLEQTQPDNADDDTLSTEAKDWQWWKIEFASSNATPVALEKVTEDAVLNAAQNESTNVLLIYASEAAVSYPFEEISPQLHNFVRADNLNFANELGESGYLEPATMMRSEIDDDGSDHIGVRHQRSTSHGQNPVDATMSSEGREPNSFGFESRGSPPSTLSSGQQTSHLIGSFDDSIPMSLQGRQSTADNSGSPSDQTRMVKGQEMQERLRGQNLLSEQYSLGSYVP